MTHSHTVQMAWSVNKFETVQYITFVSFVSSEFRLPDVLLVFIFLDCLLAWQFFSLGHLACGVWTLVFVLVPTLTLQLLSIRWYIAEKRRLCCSWTLLAHIFLVGPVLRYVHCRCVDDSHINFDSCT